MLKSSIKLVSEHKSTSILVLILSIIFILFGIDSSTLQEENAKTPPILGESVSYVKVTSVIDGDTIEISSGERIRYIGINTPEIDKECYSKESLKANEDLVLNKTVRLVKDVSETDKFGRLLRYVYVGDTFVNEYLVEKGFAQSRSYPPDTNLQSIFDTAQQGAQQQNLGYWKECTYQGHLQNDSKELEGCVIKGNISSGSGSKIYHLPQCKNYFDTKIDQSKGERYFCTQEEAIAAGWRKSKDCP